LSVVLAAICINATAQTSSTTSTTPSTKLEAFLSKHGTVIIKEFYDLGCISGLYDATITCKAIVLYEPGKEASKIKGMRIDVTEGGKYGKSSSSFLDYDEITALSNGIDYMVGVAKKWENTSKTYTEVKFTTAGDFNAGFYQKDVKATAFCSSGKYTEANCFLNSPQELIEFKKMVDAALETLKDK
jgi:hypothetical protein